MKIAGMYSFNDGKETIDSLFPKELAEVKQVIHNVDSESCKTKVSEEKTMQGSLLYSPPKLNSAFKQGFTKLGWDSQRISCDYPTQYYVSNYTPSKTSKHAFREMDFVKNTVGIEVQFGKYAFMVYNVCAKMTIFHNQSIIEVGIEMYLLKILLIKCPPVFHILNNLFGI
ncbi:conserved hypothetical protein [Beggiatoa sp. PS]|nr:conserved hypothetical protein [Beggiatoa sp. PS]